MKRMTWLDNKKEEIIAFYDSGQRQIEIARKYGVSQTAISLRLRKWCASNPDGNRFKRVDISKEELYDLYWNQEMHPVDIGKKFGCTKMAIHRKMDKFGIPKRTKSEARKGKLNPLYDIGHTKNVRKKMSSAFENGRKIGFNNHWGVGDFYDTPNQGRVWMRSGWEAKTADYLSENNIDWYYEYKWLELSSSHRYLPDFYLPESDTYLEVKGRIKDKDRIIIDLMKESEYKFLLWDGEELLKRGIIDNSGDSEINRKYRKGDF